MQVNGNFALIDNDFLNHIAESKLDIDKIIEITKELFSFFKIKAAMHPLVIKNEAPMHEKNVKHLFDEQIIMEITFEDIVNDDGSKKMYYIYLIKELYFSLTGEQLSYTDCEIFERWERNKSLGEIHSITTCLICGSGMFLSDDKDSKKLKEYISQRSLGKINVYNRKEFIDKYSRCGGNKISRRERRSLAHSIR